MKKNKFFELNNLRNGVEALVEPSAKSKSYHSKYLLAHFAKIKRLRKDLDRLPEPEEFFFLQTDGQWNAFTFLPFVLQWYQVKELYACTYSISRRAIEAMVELYDAGKVDRLVLMISDSMQKRNPITTDLLAALSRERGNIEVKYAWTHAKITLMRTLDGYFVVEGSGNWSENAHYEQYTFANSRGLFEFRKELFESARLTNLN